VTETHEPTKLEKIKTAIRPLTDDGKFRLETVAYGLYPQDFIVQLCSDDFMIFFKGANTSQFPFIYCSIYIPSKKIWFYGERLFPAIDIDIPFGIPDPRYSISSAKTRPVMDIDLLDFYSDLGRLCREVKKNWIKIQLFFSPEMINETVRLYTHEYSAYEKRVPDLSRGPYPVKELEPYQEVSGKTIPEFEDIRKAISPLDKLSKRDTITIHIRDGRIDITTYFNSGSHSKILFHNNKDGIIDVYHIARPWINTHSHYTTDTSRLLPQHLEQVVFSLPNLTSMLHIKYTKIPKDLLSDLHDYCLFISEHAEKINSALDYMHLKETYDLLKDCPGNNQDEIIAVLANLNELIDY
jgi:hypothetical protein